VLAGGVTPDQKFEVCAVASNYPDEGRSASDSNGYQARHAFRPGDSSHPTRTEPRDSYTYYAELLVAVDGHGLSLPPPRASLDDPGPAALDMTVGFDDTWT
jgi:hypothetical protein